MIFNIKRKWFDLIARGEKTIEYREVKPYWTKRISKLVPGDEIVFRLGYSTRQEVRAVFNSCDVGACPYDGWTGKYYRIHFTGKENQK